MAALLLLSLCRAGSDPPVIREHFTVSAIDFKAKRQFQEANKSFGCSGAFFLQIVFWHFWHLPGPQMAMAAWLQPQPNFS